MSTKKAPIYNPKRLFSLVTFPEPGTTDIELGYINSKTGEEWRYFNYADGKRERFRVRVESGHLEQLCKSFKREAQ